MIYHIARVDDWRAAQLSGRYAADTLVSQGVIHCSDRQQVTRVANAVYRGQGDLVLLTIDPTRLEAEVRYEQGEHVSEERFPHCYGPVNVGAVLNAVAFRPEPDGTFLLPVGV